MEPFEALTEHEQLMAAKQQIVELIEALRIKQDNLEMHAQKTEQLQSLVGDIRASMARQMAQTYVLGTMNVLTIFDQAVAEVRQGRMS